VRGAGLLASLVAGAALSTIIGGRGPRTSRPALQATAAATAGPAGPATPSPRTVMMGNGMEAPPAQSASAEARSASPPPTDHAPQPAMAVDAGVAVALPRLVPLPTFVPRPVASSPPTPSSPPTLSLSASHGAPPIPVRAVAVVLPPTPPPNRTPGPSLPPPKAGCNPPYVIDSLGDRQYKPECL
jgi:hypothetical protein